MKHLIDKDALVAELEKRIKEEMLSSCVDYFGYSEGKVEAFRNILSFIDTLEVKEMDLEKEIQQHINDCLDIKFPTIDTKMIAKDVEYTARKFFKLGLKAQKGE